MSSHTGPKGKNPNAKPRKKPTATEVYRHRTRSKQQAFRILSVPASPVPTPELSPDQSPETDEEDPAHAS